jgi:oligopeptide/dipeptide ABC transporter ATP-binding protein
MSPKVVLSLTGLGVTGPHGRTILEGVSLTLRGGVVTALVGETGGGKSTVLNSILGLLPPGLRVMAGEGRLADGVDLLALDWAARRGYLGRRIGYVPQDVRSGLNPLMTARATVLEAARRSPGAARPRADAALLRAGLSEEFVRRDADRRPGRLSGGQRQRVLIAQAVVNDPQILLLDEPTASLDPVSRRAVQSTLRAQAGADCAVCVATHDLAGLADFADEVVVLYLGRIVERGPAREVMERPMHPYTRGLMSCVPRLDRRVALTPIPGEPPREPDAVGGCRFHPRCGVCEERCRTEEPRLREVGVKREAACHVV